MFNEKKREEGERVLRWTISHMMSHHIFCLSYFTICSKHARFETMVEYTARPVSNAEGGGVNLECVRLEFQTGRPPAHPFIELSEQHSITYIHIVIYIHFNDK